MLNTTRDLQQKIKEGIADKWSIGRGLYLRLSKEGTPFFMFRYQFRGKRRELIIGRFGKLADEMSLEQARDKAAEMRATINNDEDPKLVNDENKNETTIDDIAKIYITKKERRVQNISSTKRVYRKDIAPVIGSLSPKKVNGEHIQEVLDKIVESSRPTVANDALLICKELFSEAVKLNHVRYNIALVFSENDAGGREKPRSRVLSLKEIELFFDTIENNPSYMARENYLAFALLSTLLVRKGELIAAKWSEFDLEEQTWTLVKERTKTDSGIIIPLPYQCIVWLKELKVRAGKSPYLFPARRAGQRRDYISDDTLNHALSGCFSKKTMKNGKKVFVDGILKDIGFKHFVVHDLRRTGRTLLSALSVKPHVGERCLNHQLKGVERIYDLHDYFDERKVALQLLADKIAPLVNK
jgi:integrase